jgi:hypothetical protein
VIKHLSLTVTLSVVALALLPLLILFRFWWAFEELKDLPDIAGQMMGDTKDEFRLSIQDIRAGDVSKLSFLSATKGMWSIGSMLREARDLLGSYISIGTLINPFMLVSRSTFTRQFCIFGGGQHSSRDSGSMIRVDCSFFEPAFYK